mgnify:CR=1 FL=1
MSKQLERIYIMRKLLDRVEEEIHNEMNKEDSEEEVEKSSEFTQFTNDRESAIYKAIIAAQLLEDTIARA